MDVTTIILTGCVLAVAAMVQASVGLGFALFSTPLLVWLGLPLQQVIMMAGIGSLIQSIMGVRSLHASVPWRYVWVATALRLLWLVAGLLVLRKLVLLDPRHIRFTVGAALVLLVGVQMVWKPVPTEKVKWPWTAAAFSISGFLAGTIGMSGPPLGLWVTAHNWPAEKIRGFYFAVFMMTIPVMVGLMCVLPWFGPLWRTVLAGLAFAPAIWLGSRAGMAMGARLSTKRLHTLTRAILMAMGISAMVFSVGSE